MTKNWIKIVLISFGMLLIMSFNGTARVNPFIKGMTVSCQTWGYEWATPEMKIALEELQTLGVNSFAIHPYARIEEDGHVRFEKNPDPDHLATPLKWAKEMNMRVMLKPHLAYWGTKFRWRGDIKFTSNSEWRRFFNDYSAWIISMAKIAEKYQADIFCIGLEYKHSLSFESEWRRIIREVRKVYSGKLTYAANWDIYQEVKFWDALDYVGIQAYFPLVENDNPTDSQLREAWDRIFNQIHAFSSNKGLKTIFTEVGYNTSIEAAKIPWSSIKSKDENALEMQERCLRIALEASQDKEFLSGLFLWKWFAETRPYEEHENFNLQRPAVKELIKKTWQ
jgi:hypothetical protein